MKDLLVALIIIALVTELVPLLVEVIERRKDEKSDT